MIRRSTAAFACSALAFCTAVAAPAPTNGAFLRFLNAPVGGAPLNEPPRLAMSFGGQSHTAVLDTGSTGVVVSASSIPGVDRLRSLGPGKLTYSSSGRIMIGTWVVTAVRIAGASGAVETDPIPVLAVTTIRCTAKARRCVATDRPTGVAMLGIGFEREHDGQTQSTPDRNPLLHVQARPLHRHRDTC